jgi:sugar transferase EpsL
MLTPTVEPEPVAVDLERLRRSMSLTRVVDVALGAISLFLLSPFMVAAAAAILLTDGAPVFFSQVRVGRGGAAITVVKFRTMRTSTAAVPSVEDDNSRLTPIGRMLRLSSLDETPQLFHVLEGSMSLAGPRPLLPQYQPYYTPRERRRFLVRPGLTGLAQVEGRSDIGWDRKLSLDAEFVEQYSLARYLKVLARTPYALLTSSRGAATVNEAPLDVERGRA